MGSGGEQEDSRAGTGCWQGRGSGLRPGGLGALASPLALAMLESASGTEYSVLGPETASSATLSQSLSPLFH